MPPVTRSWVYAAAALLLALSLLGQQRATNAVAHFPVDLGGDVPAVVYEPGPQRIFEPPAERERGLPVLVLTHGFSGNKGMLSHLARQIARAGYAVVTLDYRGHGHNPNLFGTGMSPGASGLLADLDAALLYASTQQHYDRERIAIAGHSMGGFAVLEYASRNPGLNAVIAISAGAVPSGPYTPPNALLIFASRDPAGLRDGARDTAARFAGLDRLVLERTYGEPERGTGVRASEVGGADHITILYSEEAGRRIVDWLGETLGPGDPPVGAADGRAYWSLLILASYLVLFSGLLDLLSPHLPRVTLPDVARPLLGLGWVFGALAGACLLLAGVDSLMTPGPLAFVPLVAGRDLLAFYLVAGALLCVAALRAGALKSEGLRDGRTWLAALTLLAFTYLVYGTAVQPYWELWLPAHRLPGALWGALVSLPLFAAMEWLLRGSGRSGIWAPALGKLLIVLVIVGGVVAGLLPGVLMLGVGAFVLLFALFELLCWRMSRVVPNPWLAALFQAGWTGWTLGAVFPYGG